MNQFHRRGGCSTRRQQIVADQHAFSAPDGVLMDFKLVCSVLKLIGDLLGLPRQLVGLAYRHETCAETIRKGGSENKSARFDASYDIDVLASELVAESFNQRMKTFFVLQERGQVVEQYARLRIVGHFANQFLQIVHSADVLSPGVAFDRKLARVFLLDGGIFVEDF